MKRSNQLTLKEAIENLLETYRLKDKLTETDIRMRWDELMGGPIARHTRRVYVRQKTLVVELDSSVLREELFYAREAIKTKINEAVGRDFIREVILK